MKKSPCLLYVRLQSFHDNTGLIILLACPFAKILRHPLTNGFATEHQEVLLQSMFWWPHSVYSISPHLRLKGVSPVNELEAECLFGFSRGNKHCQLFALF